MNPSEACFWALLRAGLWNDSGFLDKMPPPTHDQWREVLALGQRTATLGILLEASPLLPNQPPEWVRLECISQRGGVMRAHTKHNKAIHSLMTLFRQWGVESILLKGQGIASQYANPYARACGDIDIYIGPEKLDPLLSLLEQQGITCEEEVDDNEKHAHFYFNDLAIELHRHSALMDSRRSDRLYQQWWAEGVGHGEALYVTPDGQMLTQPQEGAEKVMLAPPEQNAFFLFYHAFHHFTSMGVQFRQFCDVARFLYTHKGRINLDILHAQLICHRLLHPWQVVGVYLHRCLGLPTDCIPFYDDTKDIRPLLRRLRKKCLYPRTPLIPRPNGRTASKLYSFYLHIVTSFELLGCFPSVAGRLLWFRTTLGIAQFFNRANRTGTLEHYQQRTASKDD